jgi:hypothetical protein
LVSNRRYFTIKCCGEHKNRRYSEQQGAASYNDGVHTLPIQKRQTACTTLEMHKKFNPNDKQEYEDNIGVYPKMTLKMVLKIVCHGVGEFIWGTVQ